jgi:hypothetical protein
MNGEAKMPVYIYRMFGKGNGYAGSDTLDVELQISNRAEELLAGKTNIVFTTLSLTAIASVSFEGGTAEAKWEDAAKCGYITVTNIPEIYKWVSSIEVGQGATKSVSSGSTIIRFQTPIAKGSEKSSSLRNGTTTTVVLSSRGKSGYTSFPESGTLDIVVRLTPVSSESGGTSNPADHVFLFSTAPVTDGKAVLDFRRGVRQ